jgi:hypothetical protein
VKHAIDDQPGHLTPDGILAPPVIPKATPGVAVDGLAATADLVRDGLPSEPGIGHRLDDGDLFV